MHLKKLMQKSCDLLFHRQVTIGVWAVAGESPPPAWTCLFCTLPTFSSTYSLLFPLPSKKWLVGVWLRLKRPGTKVISGTKDWEHFFLGPKSWNVPDKNRNNPSITQDCPGLKTSISTFSQNTPVSFFVVFSSPWYPVRVQPLVFLLSCSLPDMPRSRRDLSKGKTSFSVTVSRRWETNIHC